jgi:signal transduction histidine kinase/ActR/RegA family two-component response regulator
MVAFRPGASDGQPTWTSSESALIFSFVLQASDALEHTKPMPKTRSRNKSTDIVAATSAQALPSQIAFLEGGGRMGALMRSRDWTTSPLGPPATWPDTLKAAVATCLSTHFPMVIWWGPELLMFYNDAWQPILGDTKHPSGLGRPGAESWPETWPIVGMQFQNALKGVASWSEDLLLASDRRGFLEECYFTYSHSPLKDAGGQVVGVCSVVSETTSRVLNERRLCVLRDLSTAAIEATSEASSLQNLCERLIELLCRANPDVPFAIQYVTDGDDSARLCASAGIESGVFPAIVGTDDADGWGIAEVLKGRTPVVTELPSSTVSLPGGWAEPTKQIVSLPLLHSNRPAGVLVVGINSRLRLDEPYADFLRLVAAQLASAVSALQLLESERKARAVAERAVSAKDEFLAMLSHELRTPLNAIVGWMAILKRDLADVVRASRAIEVIERNARQQAQLISDLLDISRITSGSMRLNLQSVDLRLVTQAALEAVTPAAAAKNLTLQVHLDAQPQSVHGDFVRLQQVVWNLLLNAVKFTQSGGRIEVVLTEAGTNAKLRIVDTGEGIDPSVMPHIFDGFRQADASSSRIHGGLGLGLTIVKHFVELHGGRVTATSNGRGQGSAFIVELPYGDANRRVPPSPAPAAVEPADQTAQLRDIRVLVIDDERDAVMMLERFIEDRAGYVRTASTAEQALDILTRETFDVIVSDIGMPGVDGYDLIDEIRRRGLATPAVALTAFAHTDDQQRAIAAGYQAHIAKPVDLVELLGAIGRLAQTAASPSGAFASYSD